MNDLTTAVYRVEPFFDPATSTLSYLLFDPATSVCALIDAVLDYDAPTATTSTRSADQMIARVRELNARVDWILETHVHADHLSAATYLKQAVGGQIGIGASITAMQATFSPWFGEPGDEAFDRLFTDGETFAVGAIPVQVIATPGHTAGCVSYLVGAPDAPAVFVGDTLFSPDHGTARCDFPGGDAQALYQSIQRLLCLPEQTHVLLCHDYRPGGRELVWRTTVAEQRANNVQVHTGVTEAQFVSRRRARDRQLTMPALMLPAVQVNLRAGQLPPADAQGVHYLRIPLNQLKGPQ
ncbi:MULTISPECIES: MBL fold metallo-hydrolase [Pseudomonas]|uniref:MBL fold metallo-hydrolase n=1 Tax=Pseudomonas quercus TaxID=2722792 RepID=A0ABX0Y965_9PSED|nr:MULTISPECIES: MBL fold metallo-hydrolase [Pseudomonas]MBF7141329.1 MBL fold metallo-hydrolase [Pseudomonas sp. LY10J]NJO99862.1 MBL fold metallo-hydrolase [Pseudomonas quercus]